MAIRDSPFIGFDEITEELYGDSTAVGRDLNQCFIDAIDDYFDDTHKTNNLGTKNNLLNFRNYAFNIVKCGNSSSFSGGEGYPSIKTVNLGSSLGDVAIVPNPRNIPDRFVGKFNSNTVLDTGYLSNQWASNYNSINSTDRQNFKDTLVGKSAPEGGTYPKSGNSGSFPNEILSDGYPKVNDTTETSFYKNTDHYEATIEVYGPDGNTAWDFTVECPVPRSYPSVTSFNVSQNAVTNTCGETVVDDVYYHDGPNVEPTLGDIVYRNNTTYNTANNTTRKYIASVEIDNSSFTTNGNGEIVTLAPCPGGNNGGGDPLTAISVSQNSPTNACNETNIVTTYYHNGSSSNPQVDDYVYTSNSTSNPASNTTRRAIVSGNGPSFTTDTNGKVTSTNNCLAGFE
jgi:hypothetical protein